MQGVSFDEPTTSAGRPRAGSRRCAVIRKYLGLAKLLAMIMLLMLASYLLVTVVLNAYFRITHAPDYAAAREHFDRFDSQNAALIHSAALLLQLALLAAYFSLRRESIWDHWRLALPRSRSSVLLACLLGLGCLLFWSSLTGLLDMWQLLPEMPWTERAMESLLGSGLVPLLVSVGVVTPVYEELLFRGIIFSRMRRVLRPTTALILQAAVFGAVHVDPVKVVYAFALGILFALVYLWTASLWVPIAAHVAVNAGAFLALPLASLWGHLGHLYGTGTLLACMALGGITVIGSVRALKRNGGQAEACT